ncbi:MAG TPA: tyrosine-type recombinase/integrase [Armatimonadota bacterium]|jgi:integrase
MQPHSQTVTFGSVLAPLLQQHIAEKRALGCRYDSAAISLRALDRYLTARDVCHPSLTRDVVEGWIARRPNESPKTQASRCVVLRQFCLFVERQGYAPFLPDSRLVARPQSTFAPYIFSEQEIAALFAVIDTVRPHPRSPDRAQIIPLVFRLLYGCGLRISEALHLHVRDVDGTHGLLTIRDTKFRKDRLVPVAPSLTRRLQGYAQLVLASRAPEAFFFQAPDGGAWHSRVWYDLFRHALSQCGIAHRGRGQGPRIHDLRHTFACHRLARWLRDDMAVDLALPILSTYLGHESIYQTQRYLHLFPQLYPEITSRLAGYCGTVIPDEEVTP